MNFNKSIERLEKVMSQLRNFRDINDYLDPETELSYMVTNRLEEATTLLQALDKLSQSK